VSGDASLESAILEGGWTTDGSGVRIRFKEGADFWIDAGAAKIWVEWRAPLTMLDAAYFLCDPVMAFVLRRRGTLALHASAVELDAFGVAFVGAAGAGKSVSAGACVAAGARLVTDDVAAVRDMGGVLVISPGPPWLRAWDEGAETLLGDADRAPRFSETWEKRLVSPALLGGAGAEADVPLALICVMADRYAPGSVPVCETLIGRAALEALVPVTAANYLHDPETRARELGQLADLLARVAAVRLFVPKGGEGLSELPGALRRMIGG
jgi:hypothetical protein